MGRWLSDSSPNNSHSIACPANIPESMRIVDPEFPQSKGAAGGRNEPLQPSISTLVPLFFILAPSAPIHARVLAQSAPLEKFSNFVVPLANAASIAYRWEMDLSPRNCKVPAMFRAGLTICSLPLVMNFRQPTFPPAVQSCSYSGFLFRLVPLN
jgi:hypothetical protein